jgi:aspartyl-tRNA(Asn)/glutamyl-tRNA(Gln) amidotransferase subunit A
MSRKLRDGDTSSQELTAQALERANQINDTIRAFEFVDEESALTAAIRSDEELRSGQDRGSLHGIPVGIKDIIDVEGWPTRCGSSTYSSDPSIKDAEVIRKLREAGAILIGKTVPHELACGVYSHPAKNPWNLDYIPGGSSGGSAAAVSAGIVPMTLGSDTGGSIRIPAAVCGIAGIKPTFNSVSCAGVEPLSWSLDHIGPLASSVYDCALSLHAIMNNNSSNTNDLLTSFVNKIGLGLQGLRIGVVHGEPFEPMQTEIETIFDKAVSRLEAIGAQRIDIAIPELKHTIAAEFAIIGPEAGHYHKDRLVKFPRGIDPDIRALLVAGNLLPSEQYFIGQKARNVIAESIRRCFNHHQLSVIVAPTLPATVAKTTQTEFSYKDRNEPVTISYVRTTAPFNLAGLPALSTPCGFDSSGLPVGLQIVGRPMDETTVLAVGHAYESATSWNSKVPPNFGT